MKQVARRAGTIFAGTVTAVTPVRSANSGQVKTAQITFQVEQAIRGVGSGRTPSCSVLSSSASASLTREGDIQAGAGSGAWLGIQLQELPQLTQAVPGASNGAPGRGAAPVQRSKPPQAIAHDPREIGKSGVSSPSGNTSPIAIPRTCGFALVPDPIAGTLRGEDGCDDGSCRKALDPGKECAEAQSRSEEPKSSASQKDCVTSKYCPCQ